MDKLIWLASNARVEELVFNKNQFAQVAAYDMCQVVGRGRKSDERWSGRESADRTSHILPSLEVKRSKEQPDQHQATTKKSARSSLQGAEASGHAVRTKRATPDPFRPGFAWLSCITCQQQ